MVRVLVVGGGAAGYFAAITCAEHAGTLRPGSGFAKITLCEATAHPLAKVRISGGGRCNVTHACFEPAELVRNYPRGARELLGPLHRWQPRDTVEWFESRGVKLKTEEDGRIFPVTDDSATVVDCLMNEARKAGVEVRTGVGVGKLEMGDGRLEIGDGRSGVGDGGPAFAGPSAGKSGVGFRAHLTNGETIEADRVLIATGGNKSSAGLTIAHAFGHTIEPPVPSLFTFHVKDPRIEGLAGVSIPDVEVAIPKLKLSARGPMLVTHNGLSGPAILKLSAWGARELALCGYAFPLEVNLAPAFSREELAASLATARTEQAKKQLVSWCPVEMPARLWERIIVAAGLLPDRRWTTAKNDWLSALSSQLLATVFSVSGKSMNKEEFVTCGGVRLSEVNFKTMESRLVPGLFFAGEVLDIDGLTGGFNFQSAWTTGRIAGESLVDR